MQYLAAATDVGRLPSAWPGQAGLPSV